MRCGQRPIYQRIKNNKNNDKIYGMGDHTVFFIFCFRELQKIRAVLLFYKKTGLRKSVLDVLIYDKKNKKVLLFSGIMLAKWVIM